MTEADDEDEDEDDAAKLTLSVDLRAGYVVMNVDNEDSQSHGKARFLPAQCAEAMRWLYQFDHVDFGRIQLNPSCGKPADHDLGAGFDVGSWLNYVVTSMRSSSYDPREVMPSEDQPITQNGVVLCVGCKTHYTTSKDSFDNRKNSCPECEGWTGMWLKDADSE